jgi:hypothetical protein
MCNQSAAELIARLKRAYPAYDRLKGIVPAMVSLSRFAFPAQAQGPHGDGNHCD